MGATDSKLERVADIERKLAQHPEGHTTTELANEYGVDPSTIFRDLRMLRSMGSMVTRVGRRYRLDRRRQLYEVRFTIDEALSLYLAARLLSHHSDENNPHVVKALEKLADALRSRAPLMAHHMGEAARAVSLRAHRPTYLEAVEVLGRAWAKGRKVKLVYHSYSKDETTERVFAPYFIEPVNISFALHVIGYDELRQAIRTLKVERIISATLTNERYEIPSDFDASQKLATSWGIIWNDDETTEVRLRFAPQAAKRVRESVWHSSQRIDDLPDGSCLFTVCVGSTMELKPWIRQWGADVEVLTPEELRAEIRREARAQWALYERDAETDPIQPY
jgi:predicted DNA-binding transcriptional regulator YafY